jgi:MFS family permease
VLATFPGPDRARALGIWGALSGAGSALGVILGGLLTSTLGWRWIFAINIPVGLAVLLALPVLVPATRRSDGREPLDLPGAVLVTAGTGAVIYGLVNVGGHGWTAPSTLLPLAGAIVSWSLLALVEQATPAPLLTVGLLRRRPVAAGAFLMLIATGLMIGGFFLGSFALQRGHGYGALDVGLAFLPVAVAVVAGAHAAGRLATVVPAPAVAAAGLALAAIGNATAALWTGPAGIVSGLAVAALGIGATFVTAFTAGLADAGPDVAGLRSAIVTTFHELGGAFGVAVLSSAAGAALTSNRRSRRTSPMPSPSPPSRPASRSSPPSWSPRSRGPAPPPPTPTREPDHHEGVPLPSRAVPAWTSGLGADVDPACCFVDDSGLGALGEYSERDRGREVDLGAGPEAAGPLGEECAVGVNCVPGDEDVATGYGDGGVEAGGGEGAAVERAAGVVGDDGPGIPGPGHPRHTAVDGHVGLLIVLTQRGEQPGRPGAAGACRHP